MAILIVTILWSAVSFCARWRRRASSASRTRSIQSLGKTKTAALLAHYKREIDLPIAAIVAFHTVGREHTVGASVSGAIYVDVFGANTLWVFSLIFTLLVLIFSEIVPKTLGVTFAKEVATPVAFTVSGLAFVLRPLLWITKIFARLLRGRAGGEQPAQVRDMRADQRVAVLGRVDRAAPPGR